MAHPPLFAHVRYYLADHVGIQILLSTVGSGMWLTHLGAVVALPALLYLVDYKSAAGS